MGMEEGALSHIAMLKMRTLWEQAKEAVRLQALVEQLKEEELQLARRQVDESARYFDSLLAENKDLVGEKGCMQLKLQEAEERLARLALSKTPADYCAPLQGAGAASMQEPGALPQLAVSGSDGPISPSIDMGAADAAEDATPQLAGPENGLSSPGTASGAAVAGEVDSPAGSTASVAMWTQGSEKGSKHGTVEIRFTSGVDASARYDELPQDVADLHHGADSPSSISLGSQVHPCLSSTSAAFGQMHAGELLPSPSSCASFAGATAGGGLVTTPGLSVISHEPEALPFNAWLAGVNGAASPATSPGTLDVAKTEPAESPAAAATPEGAMPSPGAALSPQAAASGLTAGLSVLSRPAQPIAFAAWAAEKAEQTPSGPTDVGAARQGDSPTISLGLEDFTPPGAEARPKPHMTDTPMWPGLGGAAPTGLPTDRPGEGAAVDVSPERENIASAASPCPFGMASISGPGAAPEAASCFSTASERHGFPGSPQQSAGLSFVSNTPQAVAFDVWASVQRARTAQAAVVAQTSPSLGPYDSASPLSSIGTVSKPEPPGSWCNGADSMPPGGTMSSAAQASPAAHVRCNPLFEIDSPASTMCALPVRADALGGLAATPWHARSQPAPPSLDSTPMSDFSQVLRSNLASPMDGEGACSPGVPPYGGCSPGLFGTNGLDIGDMPSPPAAVPRIALDTAAPSPRLLEASPVAVVGDVSPTSDQSPVQYEVSLHEATIDSPGAEEPCSPSPDVALAPLSPSCATPPEAVAEAPKVALGTACDTVISSPKDMPSPAANSVVTTKFIASPDADGFACRGVGLNAQPVMPTANGTLTDASAEAEDQKKDGAADDGLRGKTGSVANLWDQGSPEATCAADQEPPFCAATPDELAAAPAVGGDGSSHSYPNTPSAAWPASPTTTVYATPLEAFSSTPSASLASFCSAIRLTAMRMRGELSTPDGQQVAPSGSATPSSFTFGFSHLAPAGPGGHLEAPTPMLGLGMQAVANTGFGSPVPLVQLTPVQLRALDQLAGHVIAAMSPAFKPPPDDSSSPAQGQHVLSGGLQPGNAAASVAFNLSQLLEHLRSPLPAPVHQRSRFAPAPEQAVAALASAQASAAKQQRDEQAGAPASASLSGAKLAGPAVVEPATANEAAPMPAASPMPNFARLMSFLNAGTRTAAAAPSGTHVGANTGAAGGSGIQGKPAVGVATGIEAGEAGTAATAAFNLAQLLAQLHSPMPNQAVARAVDAAACGFGCVDSPSAAGGAHDSPASEAASFGFSTAAKVMPSRITPGTTPGAGVSFMPWAHEAGPPSFRLDSDARHVRGRLGSRTPPTPMSFSFGPFGVLPLDEEATPAVGNGLPKIGNVDHGQSPTRLLDLHLSPVAPDSGEEFRTKTAAKQAGGIAASPGGVRQSPAASFSFNPAIGSPAFSFGPQLAALPAGLATPTAPFGLGVAQDIGAPKAGEAEAAQSAVRCNVRDRGGIMLRQGSSPALSLGVWGGIPLSGEAQAAAANRTPSERGFTFDHLAASLMATPVWPGFNDGASAAEPAADRPDVGFMRDISTALDQFATAASPTLFGMAVHGSPQDTPGVTQRVPLAEDSAASPQADACVPATAVLWTALLAGALHSPMPAAVHAHARRGWPQAQPKVPSVVVAPPSLDTVPALGSADASAARSVAGGLAPHATGAATRKDTAVAANALSVASGAFNEAPPPYEDLPDLIARGLCLSASTPAQPPEADSGTGAAVDTCSSIGENPTPLVRRTVAPDEPAPTVLQLAADTAPLSMAESVPERLFQPGRPLAAAGSFALDDSPLALALGQSGSPRQLEIESICGSNRSVSAFAAEEQAGCTTEPVPTPSRLADPEPASACSAIPDADSVHSSPVFSFHVASECSASPDSPMPVPGTSLAACTEAAPPAADSASPCGQSSATASGRDTVSAAQCGSPAAAERSLPEESPAFSLDAVPCLLFGAGSVTTATTAVAAIPCSETVPISPAREEVKPADAASSIGAGFQDAVAPAPQAIASKPDNTLAPEPSSSVALEQTVTSAFVMSPVPSKGRPCEGPASPLTFSYLGTGTPPSTPPTAELASTGKGGLFGHPRVSPRSSGGGAGQFWAPSPSGPSAASGDRVTLEACNRRIRANADLLLDFQGSPGHIPNTVPVDSVTGAVTPRMKSPRPSAARPGALHLSPSGKNWELALSPQNQHQVTAPQVSSAATMVAAAPGDAPKPVMPVSKEAPAPAPALGPAAASRAQHNAVANMNAAARVSVAGGHLMERAQAGALNLALQPGQGPHLQQLVATGIEGALASATATMVPRAHLPISQRLGLWPAAGAAWGIPCSAPVAAAAGVPVSIGPGPAAKPESALPKQAAVPQQATATAKPVLTSRDVQTTPGLVKTQFDSESKASQAGSMASKSAPPHPPPVQPFGQASDGGANGARKPTYRSRIPVPGGLPPAPAPPAPMANSTGTQVSGASTAAESDDDEHSGQIATSAAERVVRHRRLFTCAAAAGGPQRVLIKRGAQQRGVAQEAGAVAALGDEETRRRAKILGMRISPYLRTKPSKVRAPEAPKGVTKG
ncbi:hypothetical protein PLESTM_001618600 [Pleodorina starrii]|nr:hypothetical protein PLESTM_001618600 [Pleodorina starrii]